jgi:hypothetical protein
MSLETSTSTSTRVLKTTPMSVRGVSPGRTPLFVDTGTFYAYYDPDDAEHDRVQAVFGAIRAGDLAYGPLYTSRYVLSETLLRSVDSNSVERPILGWNSICITGSHECQSDEDMSVFSANMHVTDGSTLLSKEIRT